jgi:hypothetical protein
MKLKLAEITPIRAGKRRQQYIVLITSKGEDGKTYEVQLSRRDVWRIVKIAMERHE